jgi:hypothetical protein
MLEDKTSACVTGDCVGCHTNKTSHAWTVHYQYKKTARLQFLHFCSDPRFLDSLLAPLVWLEKLIIYCKAIPVKSPDITTMSQQQTENGGNHADIAGSEEEEPE